MWGLTTFLSVKKTLKYNSNSAKSMSPVKLRVIGNKFTWIPRVFSENFFNDTIPSDMKFYIKISDESGKIIFSITTSEEYMIIPEEVIKNEKLNLSVKAFNTISELVSDKSVIVVNKTVEEEKVKDDL